MRVVASTGACKAEIVHLSRHPVLAAILILQGVTRTPPKNFDVLSRDKKLGDM
jgi:hypothetical protein